MNTRFNVNKIFKSSSFSLWLTLQNLPRSTVRDEPGHFLCLPGSVVERLRLLPDVLVVVDPLLVRSDDGGVRPVGGGPVDQVRLEDTAWNREIYYFQTFQLEVKHFKVYTVDWKLYWFATWYCCWHLCEEDTPACTASRSAPAAWWSPACRGCPGEADQSTLLWISAGSIQSIEILDGFIFIFSREIR